MRWRGSRASRARWRRRARLAAAGVAWSRPSSLFVSPVFRLRQAGSSSGWRVGVGRKIVGWRRAPEVKAVVQAVGLRLPVRVDRDVVDVAGILGEAAPG